MVELSGVTNYLVQWIINPLFWLILIIVFAGGIYVLLRIRRWRLLVYESIEVTEYGLNTGVKCGWFGIKSYLGGLWWSGREVMKTKDGEEILEFSEEDFQEINGKRGVVFYRDPINRRLFPLSRLKVHGKEIVAKVPPAEYVDAALSIIDEANIETTDWKDKLIQFGAWALVIIFSLVAIIVIVQMVKNGQDKSAKLIADAGQTCLTNAQQVCTQIAAQLKQTAGVTAP